MTTDFGHIIGLVPSHIRVIHAVYQIGDRPRGFTARIDYRHLFISYNAMKERKRKAKKDRTYDSEGYTRRAGCLCFKTDREEEASKLVREDQRYSILSSEERDDVRISILQNYLKRY